MASNTNERILFRLKTHGSQTAESLAQYLEMTPVGARQHLNKLLDRGLVAYEDMREEVGRPKRYWSISEEGQQQFPDTHAQLTVELITSIRSVFGEDGLGQLIAQREGGTLKRYKRVLASAKTLKAKVKQLAALRDVEGYMADWEQNEDGSFLLLENHCPICAAAQQCQGFCQSELDVFQKALGRATHVERTDYILDGARRCAYRICQKRK